MWKDWRGGGMGKHSGRSARFVAFYAPTPVLAPRSGCNIRRCNILIIVCKFWAGGRWRRSENGFYWQFRMSLSEHQEQRDSIRLNSARQEIKIRNSYILPSFPETDSIRLYHAHQETKIRNSYISPSFPETDSIRLNCAPQETKIRQSNIFPSFPETDWIRLNCVGSETKIQNSKEETTALKKSGQS